MARIVRLDQLRTDARLYADQNRSTAAGGAAAFINDTELNRLINLKLSELYDKLVAARGHEYFGAVSMLAVNAATGAEYPLPADFFELSSLTLEWSSTDHEEVEAMNGQNGRAEYTAIQWAQHAPKCFRVRGSIVELVPTPTSTVTARLRYVPAFRDLTEDSQTFDGVNGWEKLVALGVAMEMRVIRKDPVSDLAGLYNEQDERITAMATERVVEHPKMVRDVESYSGWPGSRRAAGWYPP